MPLEIVPPSQPSPAEQVRQRVRRMARPDGMLQCNRCGCLVSLTTVNGIVVEKGRKTRGTVIEKDVCAECWRRGVIVPMLPELKQIE